MNNPEGRRGAKATKQKSSKPTKRNKQRQENKAVVTTKIYEQATESLLATVETAARDLLDELAEYRAAVDMMKRKEIAEKQQKTAKKSEFIAKKSTLL